MTANQRRPGFRLPWSSEMDAEGGEVASGGEEEQMTPTPANDEQPARAEAEAEAAPVPSGSETPPTPAPEPAAEMEAPAVATGDRAPGTPGEAAAAPAAAPTAQAEPDEFMRDLVDAMRRVAEEARDTGVSELRSGADERVRLLEADAERRREELRERTEKDVAEVGEWERSELERIKKEAEQRIVARQAKLDEQLAADTSRTEADTRAVRDRVAEYERELEGYHAQLLEIGDPAAFAAAAKRMPKPPSLDGVTAQATTPAASGTESPTAAPTATTAAPDDQAAVEPATVASNGVPEAASEVHPAEEEVLAARLAQLDATLPPASDTAPAAAEATPAAPAASAEPVTTEVVVKGLGSFGAITGFRQALSGVEGIDAVALSLGQTGEFVFRATHAAGFDVRGAIAQL
jgi:hypothetical protein